MKTLVTLALLLVGLATAVPVNDDTLTIGEKFYREKFVIYTGENDITNIVVPLNALNIDDGTDIDVFNFYVFFVEAGKGLYVFKNGVATKVLNNGKDISASVDDGSKQVFFGATDGIYTFNSEKKTAEKYGTLTDSIKNIAVIRGTNEIYILTENNVLYKVTDEGTKKEEVPNVKDAEQIVLDNHNNLFFVDTKKDIYVRSFEDGTVKKAKGVPNNFESFEFLRPLPVADSTVAFIANERVYRVLPNGNVQFTGLILSPSPTAYSAEATIVIYLGHNKKIYQYKREDVDELEAEDSLNSLMTYLKNKVPNIKEAVKTKTFRK